jgi:hypothetical protein
LPVNVSGAAADRLAADRLIAEQLAAAVALIVAKLGGQVLLYEPCDYPDCKAQGIKHTNGRWCPPHAAKMERRPW